MPTTIFGNYEYESNAEYIETVEEKTFLDFFPDENLARIVAQEFNRVLSQIVTIEELSQINQLIINNTQIQTLEGLQYLKNLANLFVGPGEVNDLSPLSGLINLNILDIQGNPINDISPLSSLTNLIFLRINFTKISDVSPLSSLTNLRNIYLDSNMISDLSPLSSLNALAIIARWQNIILEPTTIEDKTEVIIRDRNGLSPTALSFDPIGGSYNPESGTITWAGVGDNTLQWNANSPDHNFDGTITQYVEKTEIIEEEILIFSDDFEDGLRGWIVSNPNTNNPRIEVDEYGNHYLRAENGERATHLLNSQPNSKIRIYADVAGVPDAVIKVIQLNHGELPVDIHEARFANQNMTTVVTEFYTPDNTSNFYLSLESQGAPGVSWAHFDNIRIYEVVKN